MTVRHRRAAITVPKAAAGRRRIAILARSAVLLPALALASCEGNVLDPAGPIGAAESTMLIDATVIMLAIIVPLMIATIAFAWWYRESNSKAEYRPDWAYSGRLELVMWSVPLLTITFLGGIAWIGAHRVDPAVSIPSKNKTLEVQVVSLEWKWLFIYPEQHVAAINQLVVPVDTPVHFSLTSNSVWDSFFVPRLGSMIYTLRGMVTQLNLMADREGTFFGLSTHFSGDGFSKMHFDMRSVPSAEFDAWIKGAQGTGSALDEPAYTDLAKQSIGDAPKTFRSVDPNLFRQIVAEKLEPGAGPHDGYAPANVTPKGG